MKATVMFDRDTLKWRLHELHLDLGLVMGARNLKHRLSDLGNKKYLHILDVEVKSFEMTGKDSWSWSSNNLPETPTIKECIAENKANILACLSKLS